MATRPLAFGLRFRDKGRTVRVETRGKQSRRFVVEERRDGAAARRREHESLPSALRDFAKTWRHRLH
jgi:hypothetical protein